MSAGDVESGRGSSWALSGKLRCALRPLMASAAASCARAAISAVGKVPSQMRDFLRGSRISDTHLPQLRRRTPRYDGCLNPLRDTAPGAALPPGASFSWSSSVVQQLLSSPSCAPLLAAAASGSWSGGEASLLRFFACLGFDDEFLGSSCTLLAREEEDDDEVSVEDETEEEEVVGAWLASAASMAC
ncbi:hypothetical protein ACQ4PT_065185 [Festuca glaucescens]